MSPQISGDQLVDAKSILEAITELKRRGNGAIMTELEAIEPDLSRRQGKTSGIDAAHNRILRALTQENGHFGTIPVPSHPRRRFADAHRLGISSADSLSSTGLGAMPERGYHPEPLWGVFK